MFAHFTAAPHVTVRAVPSAVKIRVNPMERFAVTGVFEMVNFNTLFEPTLRYYNEVLASPAITANVLTLDLSTAQMFTVSLNANTSL